MLPRFSTSCLRATTRLSLRPLPVHVRTLYTRPTKKPLWTPHQSISKRILATTKASFTPKPTTTVVEKKVPQVTGSAVEAIKRNATDWAIIKQLMKYIWPKNDVGVKTRVVVALSLLIGGKVSYLP